MPRQYWKGMATHVAPGIQLCRYGPPRRRRERGREVSYQRLEELKGRHRTFGWKF